MKKAFPLFAALLIGGLPAWAQDASYGQAEMQQAAPQAMPQQQIDPVAEQITYLQNEWARIKYQITDKDSQLQAIHSLEDHAGKVTAAYPERPEPKIWEGIILSTDAGIVKGTSALPKVKKAKTLFEQSIQQDPNALGGSAHTSLGSLYYQVPGWPIAFGNNAEAEKHLKHALQLNPSGIDPNYFYGDFLLRNDRYEEAKTYLTRAMQAPSRPGRELADTGRRQEIKTAMTALEEKMKNGGGKVNN